MSPDVFGLSTWLSFELASPVLVATAHVPTLASLFETARRFGEKNGPTPSREQIKPVRPRSFCLLRFHRSNCPCLPSSPSLPLAALFDAAGGIQEDT